MRNIARSAFILGAIACVGAAFAACGGDDNGDSPGGTTPGAPSAEAAATTAADNSLTVLMKDFSFSLNRTSMKKGSQVDVVIGNQGSAVHTINFYTDEEYTEPIENAATQRLNGGANGLLTFTAPTEGDAMYYRCEVHPTQMNGVLALD